MSAKRAHAGAEDFVEVGSSKLVYSDKLCCDFVNNWQTRAEQLTRKKFEVLCKIGSIRFASGFDTEGKIYIYMAFTAMNEVGAPSGQTDGHVVSQTELTELVDKIYASATPEAILRLMRK